jgi:hypothetical protein
MAEKTDADEAYDEGYEKGKNSDAMDSFVHRIKDVIPIRADNEDSYDAGFEDGRDNKYNDDDDDDESNDNEDNADEEE